MSRKNKHDHITGSTKQPWGMVIISGLGFFGVFISMSTFLPYYSEFYFSVALPIGILGFIAYTWMNVDPNLWAKLLGFISIAGLFVIIAVRSFTNLFPEYANVLALLIILTTAFAHALPFWNLVLTSLFRRELSFAPQTQAGKLLLKTALVILPISGVLGAAIGMLAKGGQDKIDFRLLILGPLCWLLAVILPFSTQYPISPWEHKNSRLKK